MDNGTGSFGSAIGGTDALKAAMQSRGVDSSVLDQVSPTASTFNPMATPPAPVEGGQPMAPQGQMASQPTGQMPQTTQPNSESTLIIKALSERLKKLGEIGQ